MIQAPSNAILTRAQAGYLVDNVQFGTWNGTATSANLVNALGVVPNTARAVNIYRTDWQGQQLLYPTARTNLLSYSQNAMESIWGKNGLTPSIAGTAPDGTATLNLFTISSTTVSHFCVQNLSPALADGELCAIKAFVELGSAPYINVGMSDDITGVVFLTLNSSGGIAYQGSGGAWTGAQFSVTPRGSFFEVDISAICGHAGAAPSFQVGFTNNPSSWGPSYAGNGTDTFSAWGYMMSYGVSIADIGAYIPTTSAAVTLTDYTLSGTTVNLAQAPASTATTNATFYAT